MEISSLDLIGEFSGSAFNEALNPVPCTVLLFSDRLEIPETNFCVKYDDVREVFGGSPCEIRSQFSDEEFRNLRMLSQVIMVTYKAEKGGVRKLVLSWAGEGIDSLEYCQIMLYRAVAANRVRSKNNGNPCHGIIGY